MTFRQSRLRYNSRKEDRKYKEGDFILENQWHGHDGVDRKPWKLEYT